MSENIIENDYLQKLKRTFDKGRKVCVFDHDDPDFLHKIYDYMKQSDISDYEIWQ